MPRVLALDLATRTGCAFWHDGMPQPRAFLVDLPAGAELGTWLAALYDWAMPFVELEEVTHIALETPLIGFGDHNKNTKLISAYGVLCMIGARLPSKAEVIPIANATMFSHFVGAKPVSGKERKTRSVLAAHLRGWGKVTDHNIADALGLLVTCLFNLSPRPRTAFDIGKGVADTLFEPKGVKASDVKDPRGQAFVREAVRTAMGEEGAK